MSFRPSERCKKSLQSSGKPAFQLISFLFFSCLGGGGGYIDLPRPGSEALTYLIPTSQIYSRLIGGIDFISNVKYLYIIHLKKIQYHIVSYVQKVLERKNQITKKLKSLPSPLFPICNLVVSSVSYRDQPN